MEISCPTCKKKIVYEKSAFRPFCSQRCQLTDLGEWASGSRAIPSDHSPESESEQPERTSFHEKKGKDED